MSEMVVPDGWGVKRLGETTEVINGRAYKLTEWEDSGTPVIRLQNLTQRGGVFYYSTLKLPEKQYCQNGDLLFMWSASFGPHVWWGDTAIYHYHIWKMIPKKGKMDKQFLFFYLQQKTDEWKKNTSGMAMLHLTKKGMEETGLTIPPLPEQQKIASILTSVDEVIEKTQSQINKLQDLKKGTMNELLTKGIGHTEFKDSPVGKIPKGWEVKSLSEVTINHDSKRVPVKSIDRQDMQGVYRYYGASGIIDYVDDYLFDGQYILMGEDGENVLSRNLPLAFIVNGKFWVNNHAHIFQPKDGVDIGFLCEFLESLDYKNIASGSAQPKITKSSLNKIKVLSPPLPEQQKIASILSSMDSHIEEKQRKLEQTQSLKKSLMQDLLTGKVRVTVN